jgi:hypothetical protein
MSQSFLPALLTSLMVACGATQALGQAICKPTFAVKEVRFSTVQSMQRTWTALLDVDASRCATISGRFDIDFIRIKEYAPDLRFSEQFTWHPGRSKIAMKFWADEAVLPRTRVRSRSRYK